MKIISRNKLGGDGGNYKDVTGEYISMDDRSAGQNY